MRVREDGRIVNVSALLATGVNADGHREILGLDVATGESGPSWLAFLRGLLARGLSGVALVVSDAHEGLKGAIAATLGGAAWQRCRTHYTANLQTIVPKSAAGLVGTLVRSIFDQPDAEHVTRQHALVVEELGKRFPPRPSTWPKPARTCWPSPRSRSSTGARSARITWERLKYSPRAA